MNRGIDAIDNDGLNCWNHSSNSNSPYAQPIYCEEHNCILGEDDCDCLEQVTSDVKGKSFRDILRDKER